MTCYNRLKIGKMMTWLMNSDWILQRVGDKAIEWKKAAEKHYKGK